MSMVHELVKADVIFFMNGEKGINFNLKKNIEYHHSLRSGPKLVIPYEQSNQGISGGISNYFFHDIFLSALEHMQWAQ